MLLQPPLPAFHPRMHEPVGRDSMGFATPKTFATSEIHLDFPEESGLCDERARQASPLTITFPADHLQRNRPGEDSEAG